METPTHERLWGNGTFTSTTLRPLCAKNDRQIHQGQTLHNTHKTYILL